VVLNAEEAAKALRRALEVIDDLLDYVSEEDYPGPVRRAELFLDTYTVPDEEDE
jgi:hypothetical protein